MISKVISGGQTGVDQAALRAAKACGIPTGGYAPKDYMTEDGPSPWLADFGLIALTVSDYPRRTKANVVEAGFVVVIDTHLPPNRSRGTDLVIRLTQRDLGNGGAKSEPPREIVSLCGVRCQSIRGDHIYGLNKSGGGFKPHYQYQTPSWVADLIRKVGPEVLMVAGNRESSNPGIGTAAEEWLTELFRLIRGES